MPPRGPGHEPGLPVPRGIRSRVRTRYPVRASVNISARGVVVRPSVSPRDLKIPVFLGR